MKLKLLLFFLFFSIFCISQEKSLKVLKGVVSNYSNAIEGVTVSNITEKTFAVSDETGHFSIYASAGSILVFSSIGYESKEIILSTEDFINSSFKVVLRNKSDQLDEVEINSKINAVSLGIVSKDQKNIQLQNEDCKRQVILNGFICLVFLAERCLLILF